jgi:hypothetical protein
VKVKLSVILPGIRYKNWAFFYKKLKESYSGKCELIIISPYDLPKILVGHDDIKHIKDYGSPSRCQQIGLTAAAGEYITWGADDGVFIKNKLNEAVNLLEENKTSYKDIVVCKYLEGNNIDPIMYEDKYYKINFFKNLSSAYIPNDYWILNVGVVNTKYAKELGGWDTQFEGTTMAHMDFAVRTQRAGSKYYMLKEPILACTHTPGVTGDHAPIHFAQLENDEPLFRRIYNSPDCQNKINIDINNWKNAENRWKRRF